MTEDDFKFLDKLKGMTLGKVGILCEIKGREDQINPAMWDDLDQYEMQDVAELIVGGYIKKRSNGTLYVQLPD